MKDRRTGVLSAGLVAAVTAGWVAWGRLTGGGDAPSLAAAQRERAAAGFAGLALVELGDVVAVERALARADRIDCDGLSDVEQRWILRVAQEFLTYRFAGDAAAYASWRDALPGRRATMAEQIGEDALSHRHGYLLGRPLAEGATFDAVFPTMFERGVTADGRAIGRVHLATGEGAVVMAAAVISASSPAPPRIDGGVLGDLWIGPKTLSASSWWRPPAGAGFRDLLASGEPFGCVQVGVVLDLGSHGRRAFTLRFVSPPSESASSPRRAWILDHFGYAGLPDDPNFHVEY